MAVSRLSRKVCLYDQNADVFEVRMNLYGYCAVTSRSRCLVQIRCGPMCSDAVRCGNLSYPMPQHPFLSVARRNTSRGCGIQRRPTEQYLPPAQHQRIAKIVLFSEVFVRGCVGVNTITFEPFEISSRHFYGSNV